MYDNGDMQQMPQQPQGSSGMAVGSMVLGIISILVVCFIWPVGLILGIIGLILGAVALKKQTPGKGMAIAGLVCSIITVVLTVLTLTFLGSIIAALM